jgi:cytochrome oxidase Cu insertion factor (SCO1/SenC/PrrC family)
MSRMRSAGWGNVLKVVGAAVLFFAAIQSGAAAPAKFKPFKLKTLDGAQKTLPDVLGKATLVEFFFPTCPFCNAAFPEVQKLYDTYKPQGLSIVWINVLPDEDKQITPWMSKHGYTVPVLLGGRSAQGDYKLVQTPTDFLLDAQGNILSRHEGYKPGDEKELEKQIQQALAAAH